MLKIYNTLSRRKETFQPLVAGAVSMYVCGVTVYDYCHLGHARAMITFDLVYRYLLHKGYKVTFVRNFTDIDDKIIARANENKEDWRALTKRFIEAFHHDVKALGLLNPTHEPCATDHIDGMIDIIKTLEAKGRAYAVNGDVFYAVRKFNGYGKLSGKNIEDLESGARVDVMEAKHDPLDFALWKSAKPDEPSWDSPWGKGRPGWHIECSCMSMKYLGETFDIHGGGRDLIFPHHENEIAQSEGATEKPFAKYWLHNGFVNINTEKMSKSLNNFLTIHEIIKTTPAEAIRLFMLSSHYRSSLDYTESNIANALSALERFYETILRLRDPQNLKAPKADPKVLADLLDLRGSFAEAMDDDFNSAKVVGSIYEWVRFFNKTIDEGVCHADYAKAFLDGVNIIAQVLGVFGSEPVQFLTELRSKGISQAGIDEAEIRRLIEERLESRKNRNFKRADEIRDELKAKGIQLKDNPDGTTGWTLG